jgi:hypothetical protein
VPVPMYQYTMYAISLSNINNLCKTNNKDWIKLANILQ